MIPPVLHTVRGRARKQLLSRLESMFNGADDALFEMADRSRSDTDQNMYFDAMRELRLQRRHITEDFGRRFYENFERLYDGRSNSATSDDLDADEMSLIQNEEVEVGVAIVGIVSKVNEALGTPVLHLTRRIDSLCKTATVTDAVNPLGPDLLAGAFGEVTGTLDAPLKIRLILLKLFERYVMEQLEDVYAEANRLLAEAGVLPDLKRSLRSSQATTPRRSEPEKTDSNGTAQTDESGDSADGAFDLLQGLLAKTRGMSGGSAGGGLFGGGGIGGGAAGGSGGAGGATGSSSTGSSLAGSGPATLISTDQLMGMLNTAQYDTGATPIDLDTPPALLDLRDFVLTRAPEVTGEDNNQINSNEDDVVNLVGMLFDYILNDRNLAIPMKALIGRLQIPVLKIAILDRSFFDKTSHPARLLLNELSSAGIGWSTAAELKRDALYDKIESIVLRVLNGFGDDMSLIIALVEELREFVQQDKHRHHKVEQRVKDTEAGKARSRQARLTVQRLVNQKAVGLRLPPDIGQFISDAYSRILVLICVKDGQDSDAWRAALTAMDDLLWCAQSLESSEDIDHREELITGLGNRLSDGLERINVVGAEANTLVSGLLATLRDIADHDKAFMDDDVEDIDVPDLPDTLDPLEEIVLTAVDDLEEPIPEVEPEPKYLEMIEKMSEGTWVEIVEEDAKPVRCKLATIVQPGNRYIFVNRRGMKVQERTRMGLACDLKAGRMSLIDESEVFDRALQAVIGNLRQMQAVPKPAV